MNANNKNIVRIVPDSWVASNQKLTMGFERTRQKLAAQLTEDGSELPQRLVQLALNEAESLAWETEYPQLVFPSLAEEKIATLSDWYDQGHHGRKLHSEYAMAV